MPRGAVIKPLSIVGALFFIVPYLYAQHTHFSVNAYSGVSFFRGDGTVKNTTAYTAPFFSPQVSIINPYGKRAVFSYAFELQLERFTKTKFFYGMGLGFEELAGKANIDSVYVEPEVIGWPGRTTYPANGKVLIRNENITLHPFAGRSFIYRHMAIDLIAGLDLGFCLQSHESGSGTYTVNNYTSQIAVSQNLPKPSVDIRPGMEIKVRFHKWGLAAGYHVGLTNIKTEGTGKVYTNIIKTGICYQLR